MWVKTTYYNRLYLIFKNKKLLFTIFVLVQTYTSTQASTYRRLQPSLVLQLLLEGSYNLLALVLVDMFTSAQVLAYRRLQPSLFFQGPRFMNFQTGSINNIIQSSNIFASTNLLFHQPQLNQSIILTTLQSDLSECCNQNTVTKTKNTATANRSS